MWKVFSQTYFSALTKLQKDVDLFVPFIRVCLLVI